jgi:hypothetical protein
LKKDAPNQPWYDDQGRYTLIAAPKGVEVSQQIVPGTKLRWREDILPAIWRLYSPIPHDVKLGDRIEVHGKFLRLARWESNGNFSTAESPTFLSWLASCSFPLEIHSPADLPSAASFEVLKVAGGRVLMHSQGVTLFDDWTSQPLDVDKLTRTISRVADASRQYARFLHQNPLGNAMSRLRQTVLKQGFNLKDVREWKDQVLTDKPAMLAVATRSAGEIESTDQMLIRQGVERQWGLSEQRDNVLNLLDRVDSAMAQTLSELKSRRDRIFTAIAAGLGTGFVFANVAELVKDKATLNTYEWQLQLTRENAAISYLAAEAGRVEWWEGVVIVAMLAGFGLGFLLFWKWGSRLGGSE